MEEHEIYSNSHTYIYTGKKRNSVEQCATNNHHGENWIHKIYIRRDEGQNDEGGTGRETRYAPNDDDSVSTRAPQNVSANVCVCPPPRLKYIEHSEQITLGCIGMYERHRIGKMRPTKGGAGQLRETRVLDPKKPRASAASEAFFHSWRVAYKYD